MRIHLLTFVLLLGFLFAKTGNEILLDETIINIKNINKAKIIRHYQVLVTDEYGKDFGSINLSENKYRKLKKFKATITKNGKKLKTYKKKNLRKEFCSAGFELYSGITCYTGYLQHTSFPYILDVYYEYSLSTLFFLPNWYPQAKLSTRYSRFRINKPSDISLNYHEVGDISPPDISRNEESYTWEMSDIPKYPDELFQSPESSIKYALLISASDFEFENSKINTNSWKNIGAWYSTFIKPQFNLKDNREGLPKLRYSMPIRDKIEYLYEFLQQNTRYVAIELNEHGYLPHSALDVRKNQYGDCKDLGTYYISLLNIYGVKAYPVLVLTRDAGLTDEAFPSLSFNHFITMIPVEKDTFWIDCTSEYATIDDYPYSIEGTNALVVTEDGGQLIHIPQSNYEDNKLAFNGTGILDDKGGVNIQGVISFTGNYAQHLRYVYSNLNTEKWRNWILGYINDAIPAVKLNSYSFLGAGIKADTIKLMVNYSGKHFTNNSGNRIYFAPSIFRKVSIDLEDVDERETDVFYRYPSESNDTIKYIFPSDYELQFIPELKEIKSEYGLYRSEYVNSGNELTLYRNLNIYNQVIPVEEYKNYFDLMLVAKNCDKQRVILEKSSD